MLNRLLAASSLCSLLLLGGCGDGSGDPIKDLQNEIGKTCAADPDCSAIPGGYCPKAQVCTRKCIIHTDCGCPDGTTNGDIGAGKCRTACVSGGETDNFCFRVCKDNSGCPTGKTCNAGTNFSVCF